MRHVFRKAAAALIASVLVLAAPGTRAYAQAIRGAAKGASAPVLPVPSIGTLPTGLNTSAGSVPLGASAAADQFRLPILPVPSALEAVVPAQPLQHAAAPVAPRRDTHAVPAGESPQKREVLRTELAREVARLKEEDVREQELTLDRLFVNRHATGADALPTERPADSPRAFRQTAQPPALQAVPTGAAVNPPDSSRNVRGRWSRLEPLHRVASVAASLSMIAYGMHRLMMGPVRSAFYSEILKHRPLTPHELFDRGSFDDFITVPVAAAMVYLLGLSLRSIGLSGSTINVGRQSLRDSYRHVVMWFMPALSIWYEISQGPRFDFMDVIMYLAGAALVAPVQYLLWWPRADGRDEEHVFNVILLLAMTAILGGFITVFCIEQWRLPLAALLAAGAFFTLRPNPRKPG